jgi:hypothetical protein
MTTQYFDLHTSGIGYLNRVREVKPTRGQPFLAVDIVALHGRSDEVQRTRFDCRISGAEAERVVRERLMAPIEADSKVLVGFKIGDLYVDTFVYPQGERAGETGVSLKARLLRVLWAKVDGESVYRAPAPTESAAESD